LKVSYRTNIRPLEQQSSRSGSDHSAVTNKEPNQTDHLVCKIQFRLTLSCEDEDLIADQEETHLPMVVVVEYVISITLGRSLWMP
jgi:hypothetical protein